MAEKEFGRVCQKCKKKGGDTFARVYYKPIDGKWLRLCGVCWDAVEHHAHLTPETQPQSQAVVNASALEQSDGDTSPAQAQVA